MVFGNEVVVFPWRASRDRQLEAIDEEQAMADAAPGSTQL
jgi:hypothetical protein